MTLFSMIRHRDIAWGRLLAALVVSVGLVGCITAPKPVSRSDSAPTLKVSADRIADAIPRHDIVTRAGNKNPYTVMGKTYHLLPTSEGYKEHGTASWYGTKFQGRPTANGETYNLYAMTAAHRTLLIPTYVKVTNLENGRTAIVRVNDRGPFHGNRIIDLSYAAAVKLGYAEKGVARVQVETIKVRASSPSLPGHKDSSKYYLQVGAFKSMALASKLKTRLLLNLDLDVSIKSSEPQGYYQVHVGPLSALNEVEQVSEQLLALGLDRPHLISR
jgi:peptidoglycan lytic transglycosylase